MPRAAKSGSPETNQSVTRALRILNFLGTKKNASLKEVCEGIGLSQTIVYRLLTTLESERFVERDAVQGGYRLGTELLRLARSVDIGSVIRACAAPYLSALAEASGDSTILLVEDSLSALCIARYDGDYPIKSSGMQPGTRAPLYCGAGPFTLLSFSSAEKIDSILAMPRQRITAKTIIDEGRLRSRIERVKRDGFVISDEDAFNYLVSIGAPVFDKHGELIAAISLGGIKPRYTRKRIDELVPLVVKAAQKISASIS
jgi:DNA-binding IclR family transcriptional regulator